MNVNITEGSSTPDEYDSLNLSENVAAGHIAV